MNRIYIVRHGQDEDNVNGILNGHRNTPLTEKGTSQACELAKHIKSENIQFDTILCSPLLRARKTAQIIAQTCGKDEPIVEQLLIERDFGIMSGKKMSDIPTLCADNLLKTPTITYFLSPEGAEKFDELLIRAQKCLDMITEKYPNKTILIATHGDIGKMLYATFFNLDWKEVLISFHFGNSEMLVLDKSIPKEKAHVFKQEQFNL